MYAVLVHCVEVAKNKQTNVSFVVETFMICEFLDRFFEDRLCNSLFQICIFL